MMFSGSRSHLFTQVESGSVQEVTGDQPSAYDRHTIVHSTSTGRLGLSRLGSRGEVTPKELGSLPLPARLADPFPKHLTDSFFSS